MIIQEVELTNKKDASIVVDFNKLLNGETNKDYTMKCSLVNDMQHKLFDATVCMIRVRAIDFFDCLNSVRTKVNGVPLMYAHEYFRSVFEVQHQADIVDLHSTGNISDTKIEINRNKTVYLSFFTK